MDGLKRGFEFLRLVQTERGSLHGDYDGPLFLLPGYVFAHVATNTPLAHPAIIDTLHATQNSDGGWGLYLDGPSSLFTSVLSYVALRLVGLSPEDDAARRARRFIQSRGGAGQLASWGKYWLCILNLHDWDGVHPVMPELWAAPSWLPAHPSTWWCYARTVYLPIAYLYGRRWQMPLSSVTEVLRDELYDRPYAEVRFAELRGCVDERDCYAAPGWLLRTVQHSLGVAERCIPGWLRERSLAVVLDHLYYEDRVTDFLDIGPVSKALNVVAAYAAAPTSEHTHRAIAALPRYLFACQRGLTMQAYNSTELWDTALAALALVDAGGLEQHRDFARAAHRFIDDSQLRDDCPDGARYFRDRRRGGWTFSTRASGWPVADCTALGILSSLALAPVACEPLHPERLLEAVELLLATQNHDGGWSTCERQRGGRLLERFNPSELFAEAMVDHSHVEITALVIVALVAARPLGAISDRALRRALRFVRKRQRSDGSWEGGWGICFTYGTMFAVWALRAGGAANDDPAFGRAADFLAAIQLPDGGWGESIRSCTERRYIPSSQSQPAMTAWAVLALHRAQPNHPAIVRGTDWLRAAQQPNGDWSSSAMTGVFNRTTALNYRYYRTYFPLWALALASPQRGPLAAALGRCGRLAK